MIWWLISILAGYASVPILEPIFKDQVSENYKGDNIPTGLGLAFIVPTVLIMTVNLAKTTFMPLFIILILFFSLLGVLDDSLGNKTRKGFRGHFGQSNLSTGILKALGGAAMSLALVIGLGGSLFQILINGMVIALSANLVNLLDRAPGRAGKFFVIVSLLFILFNRKNLIPLFWLLGSTIGYLPWDLKGTVMMGDTGSNVLGASLGLSIVITLPLGLKVIVVFFLLLLNLLSEKISFSEIIESNNFLNFLDKLGR